MAAVSNHLLAAASRVWQDVGPEFAKESTAVSEAKAPNGDAVSTDELKKVATWMEHTVTKFSASASVADAKDHEGLKPIAAEVVKAFTATLGTLLSMRRCAGPSLSRELLEVARDLAAAIDALGAAAQAERHPLLAQSAGKALERIKQIEKLSPHNHASIRRRILQSLAQLRDANRELKEALSADSGDGADSEGDGDSIFGDEAIAPEERAVLEALAAAVTEVEETLMKASKACVPSASVGDHADPIDTLEALEETAVQGALVAHAVDGVAAHAMGGLEVEEVTEGLGKLRSVIQGLAAARGDSEGKLLSAVETLQTAVDIAAKES
eukprot:CAMPEP_0170618242 /NCGR_PEP_ID=MMETSP0224-20130122/26856_1 /TAXON_ID=285029 /ORGANISM="Togula jolla, Strain CCCM 725" /LENGTH=325 /DNA_ID=CAMNT_0010944207 /DNA_START=65 /DNA_END=1042 /DNA_ORIENTATION=-